MENIYIFCPRCKKKTLRKIIKIEEKEVKGKHFPYKIYLLFGECSCGVINSNIRRKM